MRYVFFIFVKKREAILEKKKKNSHNNPLRSSPQVCLKLWATVAKGQKNEIYDENEANLGNIPGSVLMSGMLDATELYSICGAISISCVCTPSVFKTSSRGPIFVC
jgi:hypothetical protein